MKRRKFITSSCMVAVGVGVFGNIRWNNDRFEGDSPTATDILGPFYRPGAPFRTALNPPGFTGNILQLSGTIYKEDGKTPVPGCLVEIWQCKEDGYYDNISDDYLYRASQKTGANGKYQFITAIPVPEPVDEKATVFRPAHIHLRISATKQQDLVTQIYFQGDELLASDPSTKSGLAINRTLTIKKIDDKKSETRFDIILRKEYVPEDAVFHKISGIYKMNDGSLMEFYRDGDLLFYKTNNQVWGGLAYTGNNTFGGKDDNTEARFELKQQGAATVWFRFSRRRELKLEGNKILNYHNSKSNTDDTD